MCMKSTETAVKAIVAADPSITAEMTKAALAALRGETAAAVTDQTPIDRALTPKQVAGILGVSRKTVTKYGRKGLIQGIGSKDGRGAIRYYAASSVRAFLAGANGNANAEGFYHA